MTSVLNLIYVQSGLRIGFSVEGITEMILLADQEGGEVAVTGGSFVPFWVGNGGVIQWLGVFASVIQFSLVLYLLFTLRRFVQTVIDGSPFIIQNKVRLRRMGVSLIAAFIGLVLVAGIHEHLFVSLVEEGAVELLTTEPISLRGTPHSYASLWLFIAGLLCIVISDAFRYGADLQVKQDLTV